MIIKKILKIKTKLFLKIINLFRIKTQKILNNFYTKNKIFKNQKNIINNKIILINKTPQIKLTL